MVVRVLKQIVKNSFLDKPARELRTHIRYLCNQKEGIYDVYLEKIMNEYLSKSSNCIDIGANEGYVLEKIVEHCPDGKHFAFEPQKLLAEKLKNKFPLVSVKEMALGDYMGTETFYYYPEYNQLSGLMNREKINEEYNTKPLEAKVLIDKLDNIIPQEKHIDFIKIDVEGAEVMTLRGSIETIKKSMPIIVFEHGLGGADCFNSTPEQVFSILCETCDMEINLVDRFIQNKAAFVRSEFLNQFYQGLNYFFVAYPKNIRKKSN